jgi:dipeptidyl aminopeptidase/acylaminoacyl peptidase
MGTTIKRRRSLDSVPGVAKRAWTVIPGEGRLMRIPVEGGTPQIVFPVTGYIGSARLDPDDRLTATGQTRFRCPSVPGAPCVLSEQAQSRVVFTAFDPLTGRKGKLAELDVKDISFWDLSRDGRWIAFGRRDGSDRIRLLSPAGEAPRELSTGGWMLLESASWAADGKSLFVSGFASKGGFLLRVGLDGRVEFLHRAIKYMESPVASPDGRYVAFAENTADSNAFVIDNLR